MWYKLPPYHVLLSISLYALCKIYKKLSPFLWNSEARTSSWTKRLEFFLSKLFHWKRIIRTSLTLYWNAFIVLVCGFFLIYVYCSSGLNIGFSLLRRRRCFYSRQRRWFVVDKGVEQDRLARAPLVPPVSSALVTNEIHDTFHFRNVNESKFTYCPSWVCLW